MTKEQIREALTDEQALTCTLIGEVLNEPLHGVLAVGSVIRNRVVFDIHGDKKPDWWGEGYKGVCLKSWQFSCWWETNSNTERVYQVGRVLIQGSEPTPLVKSFQAISRLIIKGEIPDLTYGSDHYLTNKLLSQLRTNGWYSGSKTALWAKGRSPIAVIGGHSFFKLENGSQEEKK